MNTVLSVLEFKITTVSSASATAILEPDELRAIAIISPENDLIFFGFFIDAIEKRDDFPENKIVDRFITRLSISSSLCITLTLSKNSFGFRAPSITGTNMLCFPLPKK